MSNRVGALLMPAPRPAFGPTQPDQRVAETLDPALGVLGPFFAAVLERYCGPAWRSIARGEPIVRTLKVGFRPEDLDFSSTDLPLLAVWREHDGTPTRNQDDSVQAPSEIGLIWILPPADEQRLAARSPFFNNFVKTMQLVYQNERDPCWIRKEDEASPAARTYGSYVWGLAGINQWVYHGTKRLPVHVGRGEGIPPEIYPSYISTWSIVEGTATDPAEWGSTINGTRVGVEPTSIRFDVTDKAGDPDDGEAIVRQSGLVPPAS